MWYNGGKQNCSTVPPVFLFLITVRSDRKRNKSLSVKQNYCNIWININPNKLITKLKFIINFLPLLSQVFKTFLVLVIPRHKTEKWQATYHLDLVQRGHEFLIEQDPFLQIMATQLHVLKKLSPVAWWKLHH